MGGPQREEALALMFIVNNLRQELPGVRGEYKLDPITGPLVERYRKITQTLVGVI